MGLSSAAHADSSVLAYDDFVGMTFWLISMGMLAATVFFFMERGAVATGWKTPVTLAGLITGIAFVNYLYVRGVWIQTGDGINFIDNNNQIRNINNIDGAVICSPSNYHVNQIKDLSSNKCL